MIRSHPDKRGLCWIPGGPSCAWQLGISCERLRVISRPRRGVCCHTNTWNICHPGIATQDKWRSSSLGVFEHGTLEIDFCKRGIWLNIRYCLFNSYIRKELRSGIGVDIGMLWSAAIMNDPDIVSVWLSDSDQWANNSGFCLCYYVIAVSNFFVNLFLYFITHIACGRWFVVANFRLF